MPLRFGAFGLDGLQRCGPSCSPECGNHLSPRAAAHARHYISRPKEYGVMHLWFGAFRLAVCRSADCPAARGRNPPHAAGGGFTRL